MKIRAIGTGSPNVKHPLIPSCLVVQSDEDIWMVGCPWPALSALERYSYDVNKLSLITFQTDRMDQISGICALAPLTRIRQEKPIMAAPSALIDSIKKKIEPELGFPLDEAFDIKRIQKMTIKEEYYQETIVFVRSTDDRHLSYGLRFENAGLFVTGETELNEDWLFKEMASEIILHTCKTTAHTVSRAPMVEQLSELPLYLQNKIWLTGYEPDTREAEQPFPMMFLPAGAALFDSTRRDKLMNKSRLIREHTKKQI